VIFFIVFLDCKALDILLEFPAFIYISQHFYLDCFEKGKYYNFFFIKLEYLIYLLLV